MLIGSEVTQALLSKRRPPTENIFHILLITYIFIPIPSDILLIVIGASSSFLVLMLSLLGLFINDEENIVFRVSSIGLRLFLNFQINERFNHLILTNFFHHQIWFNFVTDGREGMNLRMRPMKKCIAMITMIR